LSKKSNRRSKIASYFRTTIALLRQYGSYFRTTIALFRQYGSFFRTAIVSALF
jgi:uncharacterized membrane protein YobD (UPF0266 family)